MEGGKRIKPLKAWVENVESFNRFHEMKGMWKHYETEKKKKSKKEKDRDKKRVRKKEKHKSQEKEKNKEKKSSQNKLNK
jgi:hypothetical protein